MAATDQVTKPSSLIYKINRSKLLPIHSTFWSYTRGKVARFTCDYSSRKCPVLCRYLLEAAEHFGSDNDNAAKDVTTMGEVFSVSLPVQFQDLDLAEECITTALQISPTCSKANHRMGLFQLFKVSATADHFSYFYKNKINFTAKRHR